eukprot:8143177-Pyramimonas_sp.AAC.1
MPQGFEQTSQVHPQAYRTKKLKNDGPVTSKKILYDLSMNTNLRLVRSERKKDPILGSTFS